MSRPVALAESPDIAIHPSNPRREPTLRPAEQARIFGLGTRPSEARSRRRLFTELRQCTQRPTLSVSLHETLASARRRHRECLSVEATDPERRNELLFFLPCP